MSFLLNEPCLNTGAKRKIFMSGLAGSMVFPRRVSPFSQVHLLSDRFIEFFCSITLNYSNKYSELY